MKVLIVGSNGFLGRNIAEYFKRNSINDVTYLSRSELDLTDRSSLSDFCQSYRPDILLHVAVSLTDFNNNILMYLALEECSQFCGKVIMIGSGAEYSHQRYKPLMEEDYFNPLKPPSNNNVYQLLEDKFSLLINR